MLLNHSIVPATLTSMNYTICHINWLILAGRKDSQIPF